MPRGILITIEGIDGAGKSTLAAALVPALAARGHEALLLREPGGVELAERVRALVKDPALPVAPRAEALLYAAARAQLVEELLRPRLQAGGWALLDRFTDSSLAYQGAGRTLAIADVARLSEWATEGLVPDLTVVLDLDPEVGLARAGDPDRLEAEPLDFHRRVRQGFLDLAAAAPARYAVIDASRDPDEVFADVAAAVLATLTPSRRP